MYGYYKGLFSSSFTRPATVDGRCAVLETTRQIDRVLTTAEVVQVVNRPRTVILSAKTGEPE